MRLFRQSVLARFAAAVLLASLGLGVAAPAWASSAEDWLPDGTIPPEILSEALDAAETPEAFVESLVALMGPDAPSADALLVALYGHFLRVFQYEQGSRAVLGIVAAASTAVPSSAVGASVLPHGPRTWQRPRLAVPPAVADASDGRSPRERHPAVQPLGP